MNLGIIKWPTSHFIWRDDADPSLCSVRFLLRASAFCVAFVPVWHHGAARSPPSTASRPSPSPTAEGPQRSETEFSTCSSAVQHAEQPSATAGTQQEVLERFHTPSGTDCEDSRPGKPTEVLAPAPAAVVPATGVRPLGNQLTPLSGARGPSAVTSSPPQELSPVRHTAASTGTQTLVSGHNADVEGSTPVLVQPPDVDQSAEQERATLGTQEALLNLHKQLLFRDHQICLMTFRQALTQTRSGRYSLSDYEHLRDFMLISRRDNYHPNTYLQQLIGLQAHRFTAVALGQHVHDL
ncbi:hypothetical protein Efla_002911 [Eimeria flavescens]